METNNQITHNITMNNYNYQPSFGFKILRPVWFLLPAILLLSGCTEIKQIKSAILPPDVPVTETEEYAPAITQKLLVKTGDPSNLEEKPSELRVGKIADFQPDIPKTTLLSNKAVPKFQSQFGDDLNPLTTIDNGISYNKLADSNDPYKQPPQMPKADVKGQKKPTTKPDPKKPEGSKPEGSKPEGSKPGPLNITNANDAKTTKLANNTPPESNNDTAEPTAQPATKPILTIYFQKQSSEIDADDKRAIQVIAQKFLLFKKKSPTSQLIIQGHADTSEGKADNVSQVRAVVIQKILLANKIAKNDIKIDKIGAKRPKSGDPQDNMRVEIFVQ